MNNKYINQSDLLNVMHLIMDDAQIGENDEDYESLDDIKEQYIEIVKGMETMSFKNKQFENVVEVISNYATSALQSTLTKYGQLGYSLVNVTMAENEYGVMVMYCFFTKEIS